VRGAKLQMRDLASVYRINQSHCNRRSYAYRLLRASGPATNLHIVAGCGERPPTLVRIWLRMIVRMRLFVKG
jgi:hypothetical protein